MRNLFLLINPANNQIYAESNDKKGNQLAVDTSKLPLKISYELEIIDYKENAKNIYYKYRFFHRDKSEAKFLKDTLLNVVCNNSTLKDQLNNGYTFTYDYVDKNLEKVGGIEVDTVVCANFLSSKEKGEVNDEIDMEIEKINAHLPQRIISDLELAQVTRNLMNYTYHYRFLDHKKEDDKLVEFLKNLDSTKYFAITGLCQDLEMSNLLRIGGRIDYEYVDKNGDFIGSFKVTNNECTHMSKLLKKNSS